MTGYNYDLYCWIRDSNDEPVMVLGPRWKDKRGPAAEKLFNYWERRYKRTLFDVKTEKRDLDYDG